MKVTLNWLKQYVDFDWTPEQLRDQLTMIGIEVEGMEKRGGGFEGVVVAQILASERHPNADKLSVCRVNDGKGERQIVCGAKNFKVGDKVPLALPGCTLPTPPGTPPFTIKIGKLRGVESCGMMCSGKELGLTSDADGLMILPETALVGQEFAAHLGKGESDIIYDLEITPNRPDLNSVIGIAREISAITGNPLKLPQVQLPVNPADSSPCSKASDWVDVRIDAPELCPRYVARMVRGVKIGPSPQWLQNILEKVGIRSISNVVDVTNFVMLEIGQPLHAFDYHLLEKTQGCACGKKPVIVVRCASEGDKFTTLDGQERMLTTQSLVIADENKAVALAGIMGGLNTEIKDTTQDVLIESACFKPQNIRATSKKVGLKSDASYRFERGSDIGICDWASRRAAQLIVETAGGTLVEGVVDAYPKPFVPKQITLRLARTNQLLGTEVANEKQISFLNRLGCECISSSNPSTEAVQTTFSIPSFRVDLKREIDLIEEVGRMFGIENIPARAPGMTLGHNEFDAVYDQLATVRRILTGLGFTETQGQTLLPETAARILCSELVFLQNPLSSDMNVLRPSLLPGLLDALRRNISRKNEDLSLFEVGRVFIKNGDRNTEERRVSLTLTGKRNYPFWTGDERDSLFDIYDLKGALEELFEHLGVRGLTYTRNENPQGCFIESAAIQLGKQTLGEMGQLLPTLARQYDLRDPVFMAELNLDLLLSRRVTAKSFKPLPAYPSIRRDIAMLVAESVTHDSVLSVIKQAKPQFLESVQLFDVFRGKNVPEGQKSVAYAFLYRHSEKTLTDAEVNAAHDKVVTALKQNLAATVREA